MICVGTIKGYLLLKLPAYSIQATGSFLLEIWRVFLGFKTEIFQRRFTNNHLFYLLNWNWTISTSKRRTGIKMERVELQALNKEHISPQILNFLENLIFY